MCQITFHEHTEQWTDSRVQDECVQGKRMKPMRKLHVDLEQMLKVEQQNWKVRDEDTEHQRAK